uniref:Uncharacterized protein n=1 Tax=Trichogramma kaykai TaxID=54128 RepID=A0ABD2WFR9_9HYME
MTDRALKGALSRVACHPMARVHSRLQRRHRCPKDWSSGPSCAHADIFNPFYETDMKYFSERLYGNF